MDREYTHRATKLLGLACQWEGEVSRSDLRYLELTKFHLMAPILNPLMRLKFGEVRLKKLYKKARGETPLELLPSSSLYPFNDFDGGKSDSPDNSSSSDEVSDKEANPAKKRRKNDGASEKKQKAEEEKKVLDTKLKNEKRAAAEKELRDAEMDKERQKGREIEKIIERGLNIKIHELYWRMRTVT